MERQKLELERALEGTLGLEERERLRSRLDAVTANVGSLIREQSEEADIDAQRVAAMVWVQRWKVSKALFDRYGGPVHYQQAGVEPFDAVREFLEEQEANGTFNILDPDFEEEFWHYWRNEGMHGSSRKARNAS